MKSPRIPKRIKRFLQRVQLPDALARALRDPRKKKGRRWGFGYLLDVFLTATILQTPSMKGVEAVSATMALKVPDSTLTYTFERVDPRPARQVLRQQVRDMLRAKTLRPVGLPVGVLAIDGKTVWTGDHRGDSMCQLQDGVWNLRAMRAVLTSAASRPCIDQDFIPPKTNEMGHFPAFWRELVKAWKHTDLFRLVTTDAGYTSKANAALIDADNYGYVMRIKDTQPTLLAELERLLRPRVGQPDAVSPWERRGGKEVQRRLFRTDAIANWDGWAHARQGWLVQTVVMDDGGQAEVVMERWFLTNVPWGMLSGGQILRVVRGHWGIENDCNWTLDVVWEEDTQAWATNAKAIESQHPLQLLSWLRLLSYNVVGWLRRVRLRSRPTWAALRDALRRVLLPGPGELDLEVYLALLG
jgi:hypothetical protein